MLHGCFVVLGFKGEATIVGAVGLGALEESLYVALNEILRERNCREESLESR